MLAPSSPSVDLTIGGRVFSVAQSPGVLHSNRSGGTTGAVLWRTSERFAEWISESSNALFKAGIVGPGSTVLELGSGVTGLVSCVLADRVGKGGRTVASDMGYALKLLRENVATNAPLTARGKDKVKGKGRSRERGSAATAIATAEVEVVELDWELDDLRQSLRAIGLGDGVDAVVACDCVYNYALIEPFVQACKACCALRDEVEVDADAAEGKPSLCIVAQQLRQPEVFEQWLEAFMEHFRVFRLDGEMLGDTMGEGSGFVVHLASLKRS